MVENNFLFAKVIVLKGYVSFRWCMGLGISCSFQLLSFLFPGFLGVPYATYSP